MMKIDLSQKSHLLLVLQHKKRSTAQHNTFRMKLFSASDIVFLQDPCEKGKGPRKFGQQHRLEFRRLLDFGRADREVYSYTLHYSREGLGFNGFCRSCFFTHNCFKFFTFHGLFFQKSSSNKIKRFSVGFQ